FDAETDDLGRDWGEALGASFRPVILDRDGAILDPAEFMQSLGESGDQFAFRRTRAQARESDGPQLSRLLRARRERPCRRAAEQRDERAAFHVDFALTLIASSASACHPASLSFIRATSVTLPSATKRSACADASPARISSIRSSAVNPFANIGASVQPSGEAASSSRARRRSGL